METYQVAICDDDTIVLEQIGSLCEEFYAKEGIPCQISAFSDARKLKDQIETQSLSFNLLILDIKMEDLTGMELAHALRDAGNRISIIFITAYDEYLPFGYDVQPIHFLMKPVKKEALENALRTDLKLNVYQRNWSLRIGNRIVCLSLPEIRYIESYNHEVIIHEGETDRSYTISLSEIERQLPATQFCRCHKSYLVNLEFVKEIKRQSLSLQGNEILPIGRTYHKTFQKMLIRYLNQ